MEGGGGERKRDRRQKDRQADRQAGRQVGRQADRGREVEYLCSSTLVECIGYFGVPVKGTPPAGL